MKKRRRSIRNSRLSSRNSWLPIDESIIPNILSFGHVQGMAKLFLQIEIILSLLIVGGTLILFVLNMLGRK